MAANNMMATKISGTMITRLWAPEKGASAVEAEVVEVATVETSASPMTITSRTSSICTALLKVARWLEQVIIYPIDKIVQYSIEASPVVYPDSEEEEEVEDEHSIPGPVQTVVEADWRVEDEAPDLWVEDWREQGKLCGYRKTEKYWSVSTGPAEE